MKVVAVFREMSEHGRAMEEFLRDFSRQTGRTIETLDPDTKQGIGFCKTYDIVQYPTLIALSDDSIMRQMWPGMPLPLISEVSFYG